MTAKVKSGRFGRIFSTYAREREKKSVFVERSGKDASGSSVEYFLNGVENMRPNRPGLWPVAGGFRQ